MKLGHHHSHAYLDGHDLSALADQVITAAYEQDWSSYGVRLVLEARDRSGWIQITHDHNGYYGFSYDIREVKS